MATHMKRIGHFLNRPYPYYYEGRSFWILLFLIGIMGMLFLFFFQPFNVNIKEHKMSFLGITWVHTVVALAILALMAFILKLIRIQPENWTVGKDILFLATLFVAIGIGQFLIRDLIYDNPNNWSVQYLLEEVRNTFLIGILFVVILVPLNHNRLQLINVRQARALKDQRPKAQEPSAIFIKTQVKQDDFEMDLSAFLYAKADRNYVEIHFVENGSTRKQLKRISLANLEQQLAQLPHIIKTHRSYLVNLNHLEAVSGNAQGYSLKLHELDTPVMVSRKMIPKFEQRLSMVS